MQLVNFNKKILGSFIADALNTEEEFPTLEGDRSILEWAEKEAVQLGLNLPKKFEK